MTESLHRSGEASAEQLVPEWDGDHVHRTDPTVPGADGELIGVDPADLDEADLIRELRSLHRTRLDTLQHAADAALANHLRRTAELETEYLARHPGREVDPHRLRDA
ncbi:DUF6158 family protein [Micromonospora rifamycinica]|uniref:DUF6158 family protein n=1 Tax=Micromonospora rifamycinica TaxID=291594 RepID=UPI0033CD353C